MSTLAGDLRTALLANGDIATIVGGRVHYLRAAQGFVGDYIWFARSGSGDDDDRALGDTAGADYHHHEMVDVECVSDVLEDAQTLSRLVKGFDSTTGTLGAGTVQAIFVRDHADDYVPRGVSGDDGVFVGALQFELVGYQPE